MPAFQMLMLLRGSRCGRALMAEMYRNVLLDAIGLNAVELLDSHLLRAVIGLLIES
jgi:hypothetical protein